MSTGPEEEGIEALSPAQLMLSDGPRRREKEGKRDKRQGREDKETERVLNNSGNWD
jgi:hypothetical protein